MNYTSSPFNLESSRNETFSLSGLLCAMSTVWLNSKLLMDCSKLAWGQKARDTYNIHILGGCKLADLSTPINSEWQLPEDQESDLVT